jgi:acetoin:2,6-dichlorophenolindophenol oxidoreductase subunit beta
VESKTYSAAINQGLEQAMELDPSVMVFGQLVDSIPGVFGTTSGLVEKFGPERVVDFPICESLMTSMSIGLAVNHVRPVLVHQRLDFSLYSMDALVNWMSLWRLKSGGEESLPITIRAVIGKGWGQGPQHSKSLYSWFSHLPGIRTCVPSNPIDAKGMLLDSIFGKNPTLILENRALFGMEGHVPEEPYRVPLGIARVVKSGKDVTVVSFGNELQICKRAVNLCTSEDVELIDIRSLKPLDIDTIVSSVKKTGKLLVVEGDWRTSGISAEIIASVTEMVGQELHARPVRINYPDSHTPASAQLESMYYIGQEQIASEVQKLVNVA